LLFRRGLNPHPTLSLAKGEAKDSRSKQAVTYSNFEITPQHMKVKQ